MFSLAEKGGKTNKCLWSKSCRSMASLVEGYAGTHCKELGLSTDQFYSAITHPHMAKISNIKKGPVYELSQIRKSRGTPWNDFFQLLRAVCDTSFTVTFDSFKVMVGRLEKKRNQLLRNKKKDEVDHLFNEPFCGVHTVSESAGEDDALVKEKAKTEELTVKLKHLNVRNVNKRVRRRDLKIAESQALIHELDRERQSQGKTIHKLEAQLHSAHTSVLCLQQRLYRSRDKVEATSHKSSDLRTQFTDLEEEFSTKVAALEVKIELLTTEVEVAQHGRDILSERLDDLQCNTIHTKKGQTFVDGVRQYCLEVLAMNVATNQDKQLTLQKLQEKKFREKEKLTEEIMLYGLWQDECQVTSALRKLKSSTEKLKALKCQLDFRKKVLEQKGPKEVFYMSKNRRKLTVDEVIGNLLSLISPSRRPPVTCSPSPFVAAQESLIGRCICHKWRESDGSESLYYGKILSIVPGTTDWFNVIYDSDDTVLSLNLIEKGDLDFVD